MVDITVADPEMQTEPRRSTAGLGMFAQACAFLAAPLLTAGVGLGIAHVVAESMGTTLGLGAGAVIGLPAIAGIFAAGALFAGASIVANYAINKIKHAEDQKTLEHSVEQVIIHNHPELAVHQNVEISVASQHNESHKWRDQIAAERTQLNEIQR